MGVPDPLVGRRVGNYRLSRRLGDGATGVVYQAEHPEMGRQVAIKLLHPHLCADQAAVGRFLDEARAANLVRHPGLVDVLDLGRTEDGQAYSVMELLHGETLAERLTREGALPVADALELAGAMAAALVALHERGVVHRDVKPANVFISRGGAVKLLDLGLAKLLGEASRSSTGALLGTPMYMSPEQCEGARDLDARADLYALGAVLYHLLTGRPPFVGDAAARLIMQHLTVTPEAPSRHQPGLAPGVDALVLRLLEKRPEDRPASAAEVVAALRGQLAELRGPRTEAGGMAATGAATAAAAVAAMAPMAAVRAVGAMAAPEPAPAAAVEGAAPRSILARSRRTLYLAIGAQVVVGLAVWAVVALATRDSKKAAATRSAQVPGSEVTSARAPGALDGSPARGADGELEQAVRLRSGARSAPELARARTLLDHACARGEAGACAELGKARVHDPPLDEAGAQAAWTRACDLGGAEHCAAARCFGAAASPAPPREQLVALEACRKSGVLSDALYDHRKDAILTSVARGGGK
ncbi:MAG: serine/threonine protein kinase [Deltaproteobacteria bacterium]|nr:serine/threonine protein kinase [Deltaproteobacteria bacterium]